jgi:hypothetical protein
MDSLLLSTNKKSFVPSGDDVTNQVFLFFHSAHFRATHGTVVDRLVVTSESF